MKKLLIVPALLLVLAMSLTACKRTEPPVTTPTPTLAPTPVATPTPAPTPTPGQAAELLWGEQSFTRTFTAGDGTAVLQVTYTLPLIQNGDANPAGAAISTWYKEQGSDLLAAAEENYETAMADYDVSKATGLPFQPTLEEMTFEVTAKAPAISVRREYYVNSGGASPSVFRFSEQFDPETGAQLHFADFFSDADKTMEQVTQAFLALPEIDQAVKDGTLTADRVAVAFQPENFYLTDSGYVFWIQAGDLPATHSYLEVTIPY